VAEPEGTLFDSALGITGMRVRQAEFNVPLQFYGK
jgi:hypothetical protein